MLIVKPEYLTAEALRRPKTGAFLPVFPEPIDIRMVRVEQRIRRGRAGKAEGAPNVRMNVGVWPIRRTATQRVVRAHRVWLVAGKLLVGRAKQPSLLRALRSEEHTSELQSLR